MVVGSGKRRWERRQLSVRTYCRTYKVWTLEIDLNETQW